MSDTIESFELTENGIDFHVNVVLFGVLRPLVRDLDVGDYGFIYSAKVGTEWITTGETCGFGFDWSYHDNTDLQEEGITLFREYCLADAVENVAKTCHELVQMVDQLRDVAKLYTGKASA